MTRTRSWLDSPSAWRSVHSIAAVRFQVDPDQERAGQLAGNREDERGGDGIQIEEHDVRGEAMQFFAANGQGMAEDFAVGVEAQAGFDPGQSHAAAADKDPLRLCHDG